MATPKKTSVEQQTIDKAFFTTLIHEGLPPVLAMIQVAQARHESGNYNSDVYNQNNNAYGYLYVPGNRFGATQGLAKRDTKNHGFYANFLLNTDSAKAAAAWAMAPKRWPLLKDVKSLIDYAHVLKQLGYYEAPEKAYANALLGNYRSVEHLVKSGFADQITQAYTLQKAAPKPKQSSSFWSGWFS